MTRKSISFNQLNKIPPGVNILFNAFFIIIISVVCIFPLLTIIGTSFTENRQIILNGYNVWPKEFSINAYDFVLTKSSKLLNAYGVSIFVTLVGTVFGITMMSMYAYAISRKDLKYKKFFSFFVYFTFIFNGGIVPFYFVYSRLLNLGNTIAVLIIPFLVDAWYVVILKTFFSTSVPEIGRAHV